MPADTETYTLMSGDEDLPGSYTLHCGCCAESVNYNVAVYDRNGAELHDGDNPLVTLHGPTARWAPDSDDLDTLYSDPAVYEVQVSNYLSGCVVQVWQRNRTED